MLVPSWGWRCSWWCGWDGRTRGAGADAGDRVATVLTTDCLLMLHLLSHFGDADDDQHNADDLDLRSTNPAAVHCLAMKRKDGQPLLFGSCWCCCEY